MFPRSTPPSPTASTALQRQALKLAGQINVLLLHELDQGVDPGRLLADPLYARDVLLVCDAYTGSELAALAQQFRVAMQAPPAPPVAPARGPQLAQDSSHGSGRDSERDGERDSSGFGVSRLLHSLFGPLVGGDSDGAGVSRTPSRAARSRFGRDRGSR